MNKNIKYLIFALISLSFNSVYAAKETFTISEATCGEIDPFEIGDTCVVRIKNERRNMYIVLKNGVADVLSIYDESMVNKEVVIETKKLKKTTPEERAALTGIVSPKVFIASLSVDFFELIQKVEE